MNKTTIFQVRNQVRSLSDPSACWKKAKNAFLLEIENKTPALFVVRKGDLFVVIKRRDLFYDSSYSLKKFDEYEFCEEGNIQQIRLSHCARFLTVVQSGTLGVIVLSQFLNAENPSQDISFDIEKKTKIKYIEWSPITEAYQSNPYFLIIDHANKLRLCFINPEKIFRKIEDTFCCATFSHDGSKIFAYNMKRELIILITPELKLLAKVAIPKIADNKNFYPTSILQISPQLIVLASFLKENDSNLFKPVLHFLLLDFQSTLNKTKVQELKLDEKIMLKKETIASFRMLFIKERGILLWSHPEFSSIEAVIIKNGEIERLDPIKCNKTSGSKIRGFGIIEDTQADIGEKMKSLQLLVLDSNGYFHRFDLLDEDKKKNSERERRLVKKNAKNEIYEKMLYADIIFVVQGEKIPAHKSILASSCDFFEKMFKSGMEESHTKEITIDDMSPDTFKVLLKYIYFQSVEFDDKLAMELLEVSDKYCFEELTKACEEYLIHALNQENCVEILRKAESLNSDRLLKCSLDYFVANLNALMVKINMEQLPNRLLVEMMKLQLKK